MTDVVQYLDRKFTVNFTFKQTIPVLCVAHNYYLWHIN
jgi:hypothetical protein